MIYLATLTAFIAIGGVGLLSMAMRNTKPGKKRLAKEMAAMRLDLEKLAGELIPIGDEELELFSHTQEGKYLKKGSRLIAKGVYTTLFHERIMAYSFKKYLGGKVFNNAVLLVRTAQNEFLFQLNKDGILLTVDGSEVGVIKDGGKLFGKKTKKVLAQILPEENKLMKVITYGNEVASMTLPPSAAQMKVDIGHRVYEFVKGDLKKEEQLLLIALTSLELVMRNVA